MSNSGPSQDTKKEVVSITKHGQVTIPEQFRKKLGIDTPGKVVFRETDAGEVVVERVRSPSEMRGFATRRASKTDTPATEILRQKRNRD
ncbi:AbrB/MazE/SpoVT family DNA-binding domain-containing protein [Natrarchaeobius oligotrophus]|uniref:AbrB/MazE/SpoVT family DNA-binding domain-containing protein n=1 Tax=Natrarchaeobius chitinivorans TaxID=1679083 RepID=A0A3N6MIS8_NATCH|nr:AbrB/MazE/SpoVT family DNA-binding domain-containing protein [Natrarchaeobius chitinivorans]RQG95621.1 AbrB/MazE/SpoVT family DNA-binding domain-containing protein [Natrarchaeobius chitinivorans]